MDIPNTRRRNTSPLPSSRTDLQSLLAFAYLQEQRRRQEAEAKADRYREQLSAALAAQRKLADLDLPAEELPQFIAEQAIAMTAGTGAAIAVSDGHAVVCRGRAGNCAPRLGAQVNLDAGLSAQCLRTGEVLCCEDSESDERVQQSVCRTLGIRSVLIVPIRQQGAVMGLIAVFSPLVGAFSTGEVRALELLAALAEERVWTPVTVEPANAATSAPEDVQRAMPEEQVAPVAALPDTSKAVPEAASLFAAVESSNRTIRRPGWIVAGTLAAAVLAASGLLVHQQLNRRAATAPPFALIQHEQTPASATPAAIPEPPAGPAVVSAVEFLYGPESTVVMIDLTTPSRYEAQRLNEPERISLDLPGARVAPELLGKNPIKTLVVNDKLLSRVRVANREGDGVRVVLDLNCACDFSTMVSPVPPYRLTIEMRSPRRATPAISSPSSQAPSIKEPARAAGAGLKIVIDPGHGGWDRGTVGPSGLEEKDLVLNVAQRLGKLLVERLGAIVIYTRTDDTFVPLESRSAMANAAQADLFVSLHGNSSDYRSVRGVETFYMDSASEGRIEVVSPGEKKPRSAQAVTASRQLAAAVQHALFTRLAADDPQLRNRGVKPASLVVLVGPSMPSVLSEISFLSSPAEEQRLKTAKYRDRIAEALYEGIHSYVFRTRLYEHYLAAMPNRAAATKAQ